MALNLRPKAMLGADGKASSASGNQIDIKDMTGQGPMGYFPELYDAKRRDPLE